jgi:hypothetical protein
MKINGWHRLGVLASGLWFVTGFFWGNSVGLGYGKVADIIYDSCTHETNVDWAACNAEFNRVYTSSISSHWQLAWIYALVPIVLGWLAVYTILALARWVRRGFQLAKQTPLA